MRTCIPFQQAQVAVEETPVRKTSAISSAFHSSRSKTCIRLHEAPVGVGGTSGRELHDRVSADSPASHSERLKTCIALQGAPVGVEGIPVRKSSVRELHNRVSADSPASHNSRMKTCITLQGTPVGMRGTSGRELHDRRSADSPASQIAWIEHHRQHTAWLARHGMLRTEIPRKRLASMLWHVAAKKGRWGWSGLPHFNAAPVAPSAAISAVSPIAVVAPVAAAAAAATPTAAAAAAPAPAPLAAAVFVGDVAVAALPANYGGAVAAAGTIASRTIANPASSSTSVVAAAGAASAAADAVAATEDAAAAVAAEDAGSSLGGQCSNHVVEAAPVNNAIETETFPATSDITSPSTILNNPSQHVRMNSGATRHDETACATWQPAIHCLSAAVFPTNFAPGPGTKGSPPNPNCTRMQQPLFTTAIPFGAPQKEAHHNAPMPQQCAVVSSSAAPVFEAPQKSMPHQCAVVSSSVAPGVESQDSPSPCTRMVPLFPTETQEGAEIPATVSLSQQWAVFPSSAAPEGGTKGPALPSNTNEEECPCPPGNAHEAHAHNGPAVLLQLEEQEAFYSNTALFPMAFAQPTGWCTLPSFTCLLNSISPSWQQECLSPEALEDEGRKALLNVQLQPQQLQLQQQRDSEVHVDAGAWESDCTAGSAPGGSSEACVLHCLSASSHNTGQEMKSWQERQELEEREERHEREEGGERGERQWGWFSNVEEPERFTAGRRLTEIRNCCKELTHTWSGSEDCDDGELLSTASSLLSIHGTFQT
ncbi:unnamed protein product [Closterium sp. NIES-53]